MLSSTNRMVNRGETNWEDLYRNFKLLESAAVMVCEQSLDWTYVGGLVKLEILERKSPLTSAKGGRGRAWTPEQETLPPPLFS